MTSKFLFSVLALIHAFASASPDFLMIGNSYTLRNNLVNQLQSLLREGLSDNRVASSLTASGGKALTQHLQDAQGANGNDKDLRQWLYLDPKPFEWVILQEQSQTPGFYGYSSFTTSLNAAVGLNEMISDVGAKTVFYQTWGRRDGDSRNAWLFPDFSTMQDRLDEGYGRYKAATKNSKLAPVGPAFRIIYDTLIEAEIDPLKSESAFHSLYSSDGSHPSVTGSYLAACVLYSTMTGKDPQGLSYRPSGVSEAQQAMLQNVAAHTVRDAPLVKALIAPTVFAPPDNEVTDAPTNSPVKTSGPSQAPVKTSTPTQTPVETDAPTLAPVKTDDPSHSPVRQPQPVPVAGPSWDKRCDQMVSDSDFESGLESWTAQGAGKIESVSPGYKSDKALASTGRLRYWNGIGLGISRRNYNGCVEAGSKWEVSLQVRLVNPETGKGVSCDRNPTRFTPADKRGSGFCPAVTLYLRDGSWRLGKFTLRDYASSWNPSEFNELRSVFEFPAGSSQWNADIRHFIIKIDQADYDLEMIVDDFSMKRIG